MIKKNILTILLLLIISFGFFLRIHKVDEVSYWIDEGFTIMQTKAISEHNYPLLNSGKIEIKDTLLPYISAFFIKIFSETPLILRLPTIIFGTLSIYLCFILGKELFNKNTGLLFSFFIAFSYWNIAWSRQFRGYTLLIFFILLFFINLIYYEKRGGGKYLLFALLSAILAILSKTFGIFLLPLFLIYLSFKRKYLICFSLLFPFVILNIFFSNLIINALSLNLVNNFIFYFIGYLWSYFGIFFSLFIISIFTVIKNRESKYRTIHFLILILFISSLIFFSFFVYLSQKRYLFFITPFIFLYSAHFLEYFLGNLSKKFFLILALLTIIIMDFFTVKSLNFYPKEFYFLESYTPQPNFNLAYDFIKKDLEPSDIIISAYPFMDLIYLGKSNYAIPISYTGREDNTTIETLKEYYSGTRKLQWKGKNEDAIDKLELLRKEGNIYITLDLMALSRIREDVKDFAIEYADFVFQSGNTTEQKIYVYKIKKE